MILDSLLSYYEALAARAILNAPDGGRRGSGTRSVSVLMALSVR